MSNALFAHEEAFFKLTSSSPSLALHLSRVRNGTLGWLRIHILNLCSLGQATRASKQASAYHEIFFVQNHVYIGISLWAQPLYTYWKKYCKCEDWLALKVHMVLIWSHMYNLYGPQQGHKSYSIYLRVWKFIYHVVLCQGDNKNIHLLENNAQNTIYVLVSKCTWATYLSLNSW